jgi:chromosome partitioning protein
MAASGTKLAARPAGESFGRALGKGRPMRRIAVINQKGGVGKTTTTANLGAAVALSGSRVLLVDLDPQGHLSLHFGVDSDDNRPTVYDVLTSNTPIRDALIAARDRVTVLPSDIDLAGAETELVSVTGREVLLREALAPVIGEFDFLLIDCPPSLNVLTVNALVAADEVIIPLQAHFLALQGLGKLLDTVTLVRQRINPVLKVAGVVLCMHESTTRLAGEVVEDLVRFLESSRGGTTAWSNTRLYETCIRRNIKLAECASFGQTIFDYAAKSNGAADYARLAEEVFELARGAVRITENSGANGARPEAVENVQMTVAPARPTENGRLTAAASSERLPGDMAKPPTAALPAGQIGIAVPTVKPVSPDSRRA